MGYTKEALLRTKEPCSPPLGRRFYDAGLVVLDLVGLTPWSRRAPALHQKSGSDARGGSSILNKPPRLAVACNFGAKPPYLIMGEYLLPFRREEPQLDRDFFVSTGFLRGCADRRVANVSMAYEEPI